MKRFLLIIMVLTAIATTASAQPTKRRVTTSTAAATSRTTTQTANDRAALQFPTAASMPDDVVWKRDIYRQLDLMKDKNAPMYYPVEPVGRQVNLFTYLFRLVLTGRVTAYAYKLDGNESFEDKDKLEVKDLLERYSIFYEEDENGKINVADSDVPSAETTRYYLKESVYLDQRTGTFSTKVTALCPILIRNDGYSEVEEDESDGTSYPLFWVKYEDIAPYLTRLPMMASNLNNVSNMTADDFFTMNRYEGKIYKTNNLQGRMLANYCENDSAMTVEQLKIEKQLTDFEEGVWGHRDEPTDSTATVVVAKKSKTPTKTTDTTNDTSSSRRRTGSASSSKSSSAPTVSARRQRR